MALWRGRYGFTNSITRGRRSDLTEIRSRRGQFHRCSSRQGRTWNTKAALFSYTAAIFTGSTSSEMEQSLLLEFALNLKEFLRHRIQIYPLRKQRTMSNLIPK